MTVRKLSAEEAGVPRFSTKPAADAEIFDLDSHSRAREALSFGLSVPGIGYNIFVAGEDRAGRMTATLAFLDEALQSRAALGDWIYVNNFRHPENPLAHRLPPGMGRLLRDRMTALLPKLREALAIAFTSEAFQARLQGVREKAQAEVSEALAEVQRLAESHGWRLRQTEDGTFGLVPAKEEVAASAGDHEAAEREVSAALTRFQLRSIGMRSALTSQIHDLHVEIAEEVLGPALDALLEEFAGINGLARWLTALRVDMLENPMRFRTSEESEESSPLDVPERRYAVNLLVDHGEEKHPSVVLESNPTYENLFGRIEYEQSQGSIATDFTLIKAGALHRANGGILVLRAEALAANPVSWRFLKAALRDSRIVIEELARSQAQPISGAPKPQAIPLDLKVVIVGAPRWYSLFFESDPDFDVYFKIKADIDTDVPASEKNLTIYAGLIEQMAQRQKLEGVTPGARERLLGIASRWNERRDRLTAQVELIEDMVTEAAVHARQVKEKKLTEAAVIAAHQARRYRSARVEDRMLAHIVDGMTMIDTTGSAVGQVNGLTVHEGGNSRFGTPVRITARASAGRGGIINIERDVSLGGPIQQKGAMVLQGYLAGRFAQVRPLSFTCSITFEQMYGGVEGDSASMAELLAVLSDLSQLPIRQEVALTGSMNQAGHVQPIGGAHSKIEGFFRVCEAKPGGLTGTQGVIVPDSNRVNLALRDEVQAAVAAGRFNIWSVTDVTEAAEILMGVPAGVIGRDGAYPPDSIFGRVTKRLEEFDRILAAREAALQR